MDFEHIESNYNLFIKKIENSKKRYIYFVV